MNFLNRLIGIVFTPQKTCRALAKRPVWKDTLLILLIAVLASSYHVVPYTRMLDRIANSSRTATLLPAILLTHLYLIGFLVSSLVLLFLSRLVSKGGNYVQVFSVYIHASLIDKILGDAVRLFLLFRHNSIFKATTSIAALFPNIEVDSLGYAVALQVDIFQLWLFAVLSLGLSSIFKMDMKRALLVAYGFWVFKSGLNIAFIMLGVGFIR